MVNVPWCHECDKPDGLCRCCGPTPRPLRKNPRKPAKRIGSLQHLQEQLDAAYARERALASERDAANRGRAEWFEKYQALVKALELTLCGQGAREKDTGAQ